MYIKKTTGNNCINGGIIKNMRTYSNGTNAKKPGKRMLKKNLYAIILGASLLIVAVAITLVLTLGLNRDNTEKPPFVDTEVPPTKVVFALPLKECVVKNDAALDKLVWNSTLEMWRTHDGVDFAATEGDEVFSLAGGTVTNVEDTIMDGIVVTITYSDGFVSIYKGLESASVKADDVVKAGDAIGKVGGMVCEQGEGLHLHVELIKSNEWVSVMDYLNINEDK